jgi:hypothetical protein
VQKRGDLHPPSLRPARSEWYSPLTLCLYKPNDRIGVHTSQRAEKLIRVGSSYRWPISARVRAFAAAASDEGSGRRRLLSPQRKVAQVRRRLRARLSPYRTLARSVLFKRSNAVEDRGRKQRKCRPSAGRRVIHQLERMQAAAAKGVRVLERRTLGTGGRGLASQPWPLRADGAG